MNDAVGEASKRTVMRVGWIAVLILGLWVVSPSARTWYIEPDGSGDAPTIQAGVDSAVAGDIVLVAAGTYEIGAQIWMKAGVTLESEAGPYETRILPAPSTNPQRAILCWGLDLSVAPTEVSGFWIEGFWNSDGGGIGISVVDCEYLTLSHNVLTGNSYGLIVEFCDIGNLRNCTFYGNGTGVDMTNGGGGRVMFNIIWDRTSPCIVGFFNNLLDLSESCEPALNFSQDPQFCGPSAGNYYLQSDSPCAPGNSPFPEVGLIGALPMGCATVKAESKTWGAIKDLYRE